MTNLPTGFEEWSYEAQQAFLSEARSKNQIMSLVMQELGGSEPEPYGNGHIDKDVLIELFYLVRTND